MQSFITGSQAYGYPTNESDTDLVLFVDAATHDTLVRTSDEGNHPVRFNNLNLILLQDVSVFLKWKECNDYLIGIRPVTREQAIAEFNRRGITGYKAADPTDPQTMELSALC